MLTSINIDIFYDLSTYLLSVTVNGHSFPPTNIGNLFSNISKDSSWVGITAATTQSGYQVLCLNHLKVTDIDRICTLHMI